MADAIVQSNLFEIGGSGSGGNSNERHDEDPNSMTTIETFNHLNLHHHHNHHHTQLPLAETDDSTMSSSDTMSSSSYTSQASAVVQPPPAIVFTTPQSSPVPPRIAPVIVVAPHSPSSQPQQLIPTPKPYPLHEAAFKGEYDKLVSLLLFTQGKIKSTPNSPLHSGLTPDSPAAASAAKNNDFVGVNSLDDKKTTPLHHAAFNGHKQCVKLLLASGAFPDIADIDGCTPLHNASFNGFKSVMAMLIEAGADVNSRDIDFNTALHKTTYSGFHKCAELLINAGSEIETRDTYGITPLLKAASNKHQKCLTLLIERGADVNNKDFSDSTALHQACYKGSDRAVTLLIQKGAAVNSIDKEGYTPLHNAVFNGYDECARILLDRGAIVDQRALDGCTPLHYSASNGFESCVSLLIRRGCKLDIKDAKRGRTALHYAANKGNLGCVELLIKAGADINTKDVTGKTPKNLTKNSDIISLLSEESKKKSKLTKSRSTKRNSETDVTLAAKESTTPVSTSPSQTHLPKVVVAPTAEPVVKQKWDVNIVETTSGGSPTLVSMGKEETQPVSPTTTAQSSPPTSSNGSLSRSASTDSVLGEKESPENTPKLDIYGFVKTSSTVDPRDDTTIRTKKTDKLERKWAKMAKNWPKFAKSTKLRDRIPKGIPSSVRGFVWQRLVNIQEIKNKSKVTYKELLERKSVPSISAQIQRDLNRTFPKHSFFVEKGGFGQQILCNILTAFSIYNPEVGYCQGMGFITCLLIIYMAEEDAFWVLVQLAEKYGMADIWKPEFPYLQTCFGIFDTLLESQFPQLFAHIHKENVFTPLFASQWFICLLIYNLPFPVIVRIWDLFLYDGLIVIFAAALSLFKIYEDQMLKSEFEEILSLLKFANGEEKTLRIELNSFMKMVVHYKHKIKHVIKDGLIKDPNV
eukprot:gene175-210_t